MGFLFKQFEVIDENCAMKVGTDAVLVGAWTEVERSHRILDVGAGSGIISLMLAQRAASAFVTAVEIDGGAVADCEVNFRQSPWASRLDVVSGDFRSVEGRYDLIVSNPPFFGNSLRAAGTRRALARQGDELSYVSLIDFASRRLEENGRLVLISDTSNEAEIDFEALVRRFSLRRKCLVRPMPGKKPKRILWDFELRNPNASHPVASAFDETEEIILRDESGKFSERFMLMTVDFYL